MILCLAIHYQLLVIMLKENETWFVYQIVMLQTELGYWGMELSWHK